MPTWPAQLPPPALNSLQESPPNNTIRSQMDKGPDKVRRRTTANIRPIAFSMHLTEAQLEILDDFYTSDTFSGSESFTYTHPRTGLLCTARFREPPSYQEREGVVYNVGISLEILP